MLLHFQLQHHKLPLSSGLLEHFLFLSPLTNSLLGTIIKVQPSLSKALGAPTKLSVLKTGILLGFSWGSISHPGIQILGHGDLSSVQSLSHVQLFVTPWTPAHQASLSITNSQSLLKLMSIESVMPFNHLKSSLVPFSSCLQSFPASGSFPMSQFFPSGGHSIGASASASVLLMNGDLQDKNLPTALEFPK